MKAKKQKPLLKMRRTCVGCGDSSSHDAVTERGHKMLSVTCVIFRKNPHLRLKDQHALRATSRVTICEECFVAAMANGKHRMAGRLCSALWERLTVTYNAMRAESSE